MASALLNESDFVASEINWDSKCDNMGRIQKQLNLKTKDFIFIDDRGDQRELVSAVFPEILVLDATCDRSWRILDSWSSLIDSADGSDRTQLYRERRAREDFLAASGPEREVDQAALMARLGLRVTLRNAKKPDLKRVVELINRTNQFNLNTTRTNFRESSEWLSSPARRILVADGIDKFGQMGLVCVTVVEASTTVWRIHAFVLSCRVFGYGIETAMLNAIKRLASRTRCQRAVSDHRRLPEDPAQSALP